MADDPRYPAAVAENIIRAHRAVAERMMNGNTAHRLQNTPFTAWDAYVLCGRIADEIEAGGTDPANRRE